MSNQTGPRPFQDDTVTLDLDDAVTIAEFLKQRQGNSIFCQCLALVNEAILLLEGLYVHLPVKRAMYAVDPVRRLQLLKLRLKRYDQLTAPDRAGRDAKAGEQEPPTDDMWFHREMTDTLTSVRDLHTMYVLPQPFDRAVAFVPFQIEGYFDGRDPKYLVSNVIDQLPWFSADEDFKRGVEVTHWNYVPMHARRGTRRCAQRRQQFRCATGPWSRPPHYSPAGEGGTSRRGGGYGPLRQRRRGDCSLSVPWRIVVLQARGHAATGRRYPFRSSRGIGL